MMFRYRACIELLLCLKRKFNVLYHYLFLRRKICEPIYWTDDDCSNSVRVLQFIKPTFCSGLSSNPLMLSMMCEMLKQQNCASKSVLISHVVENLTPTNERLELQEIAWKSYVNNTPVVVAKSKHSNLVYNGRFINKRLQEFLCVEYLTSKKKKMDDQCLLNDLNIIKNRGHQSDYFFALYCGLSKNIDVSLIGLELYCSYLNVWFVCCCSFTSSLALPPIKRIYSFSFDLIGTMSLLEESPNNSDLYDLFNNSYYSKMSGFVFVVLLFLLYLVFLCVSSFMFSFMSLSC